MEMDLIPANLLAHMLTMRMEEIARQIVKASGQDDTNRDLLEGVRLGLAYALTTVMELRLYPPHGGQP